VKAHWLLPAGALVGAGLLGELGSIYRRSFQARPEKVPLPEAIPDEPKRAFYRSAMLENIALMRSLPYEPVRVVHDGLSLAGKLYSGQPGKPVLLLFHGFRSSALRDCAGVFPLFHALGWGILLIDQRGHGGSDGKSITLGVWERYDALAWARYAAQRFGPDTPLVLMGISMGGATVLMASDLPLPPSVRGIIADCAFSSPREMILWELESAGKPRALYPLVRLSARIFAGFDPESAAAEDALSRTSLPVLLIHGETDRYVPCTMSRKNFSVCGSAVKELVVIPDAGHGLSVYRDPETYHRAVTDFCRKILSP